MPDRVEAVEALGGVEGREIDDEGLLTGAEPDWTFLAGGYVADDSDGFTGFWAMNNPQTFSGLSLGSAPSAAEEIAAWAPGAARVSASGTARTPA